MKAFLIGVFSLLCLTGCATSRNVVLHPIEKSDIFSMEKEKSYIPEKNGWFLSDEYMKDVLTAQVK